MGKLKTKLLFPLLAAGILISGMTVSANTGIERSSTGEAFTLDRYNGNIYEGKMGEEVYFKPVTLTKTEKGQHLYAAEYTGNVSISKWTIEYPEHYCIHASYPDGNNWKGFSFGRQSCKTTKCQPGWIATCAKCGREIGILFYSSKDTISQLKTLSTGDCYVSNCVDPKCNNLETATYISHKCDEVSWNKYIIQYVGNGANGGFISDSHHYYNNYTTYEGQTITPQKKLSVNTFYRTGYVFTGWNTKPDGSGITLADEEDFLIVQNKLDLGDKNNNTRIKVYAQWQPAYSTLNIDPNGGSYNGETSITQRFRTVYSLDPNKLTPPAGPTVTYDTQGGNKIEPTHTTTHFSGWSFADPLHGVFVSASNRYAFGLYDANNIFSEIKSVWHDGCVDTAIAQYAGDSFKLPEATYPNGDDPTDQKRFGGWYADPECEIFIGGPGDDFSTDEDITLYAKWSTLHADSVENWTANNEKGAIDLSWIQTDSADKVFKIYQKKENGNWIEVKSANSIQNNVDSVEKTFYRNSDSANSEQVYIVPYSGLYNFKLTGAQGGKYGNYSGGAGGTVTGRIYFYEGEKVYVGVGSQDGKGKYFSGGSATSYGNGGSASYLRTDRLGIFAIAGGGGGATMMGNGNAANSGSYRADGNGSGENGMAGGGGGNIGGKQGTAVVHHHSSSCYQDLSYTPAFGNWESHMWGHSCFDSSGINSYQYNGHTSDDDDYSTCTVRVGWSRECHIVENKANWWNVSGYKGIPTNGNTTLNLSYFCEGWGDVEDNIVNTNWLPDEEQPSEFVILDQNGTKIAQGKFRDYPFTDNFTWNGNNHIGSSEFYQNLNISLPEGTTHIYVHLNFHLRGSVWFTAGIKGLSFSGGKKLACGYTEGQVVSAYPSYGGSNGLRVNTKDGKIYFGKTDYASTQTGNGYVSITAAELGLYKDNELKGIIATDEAMPNMPVLKRKPVEDDNDYSKATVVWNNPGDNGTTYQHQVKSFYTETMAPMLESNITTDVMTSGVKGYVILVDENEDTIVTKDNGIYQTETSYVILLTDKTTKYIHVAAVDGAGNVGITSHLKISGTMSDDGQVFYPIETTPISVRGMDDNVYEKDGSYFVKADGITPFYLKTNGLISEIGDAVASKNYQVNALSYIIAKSGDKQKLSYYRENDDSDISKISIDDVKKSVIGVDNEIYIKDASFFEMSRYNNLRNVSLDAAYTIDSAYNNTEFVITPQAMAYQTTDKYNNSSYTYSDDAADALNKIVLIADGKAPQLSGEGYEFLKDIDNIDTSKYPDNYEITLEAKDDESGLKEFYVVVENQDNNITHTYPGTISSDDKTGTVTINIINDDLLFKGDINFLIYVSDNVGNITEESKGLGEFSLHTKLVGKSGSDTVADNGYITFKKGETGVLIVRTSGYADQLQIKFPSEFSKSGFETIKNYFYEKPIGSGDTNEEDLQRFGIRTEVIKFPIPYDIDEREGYDIEITAFKNGESVSVNEGVTVRTLSEHQKFNVKDSLLDGMRTYIIQN